MTTKTLSDAELRSLCEEMCINAMRNADDSSNSHAYIAREVVDGHLPGIIKHLDADAAPTPSEMIAEAISGDPVPMEQADYDALLGQQLDDQAVPAPEAPSLDEHKMCDHKWVQTDVRGEFTSFKCECGMTMKMQGQPVPSHIKGLESQKPEAPEDSKCWSCGKVDEPKDYCTNPHHMKNPPSPPETLPLDDAMKAEVGEIEKSNNLVQKSIDDCTAMDWTSTQKGQLLVHATQNVTILLRIIKSRTQPGVVDRSRAYFIMRAASPKPSDDEQDMAKAMLDALLSSNLIHAMPTLDDIATTLWQERIEVAGYANYPTETAMVTRGASEQLGRKVLALLHGKTEGV